MNKQIKLTKKQDEVLKRYHELIVKHNYQMVYVDEAYVDMTALNPIVGANWFDRTFETLVQKGLLVKVETEKVVKEGHFAGRKYTDWAWELTDLGKEYLGIEEPKEYAEEQQIQEVELTEQKLKEDIENLINENVKLYNLHWKTINAKNIQLIFNIGYFYLGGNLKRRLKQNEEIGELYNSLKIDNYKLKNLGK